MLRWIPALPFALLAPLGHADSTTLESVASGDRLEATSCAVTMRANSLRGLVVDRTGAVFTFTRTHCGPPANAFGFPRAYREPKLIGRISATDAGKLLSLARRVAAAPWGVTRPGDYYDVGSSTLALVTQPRELTLERPLMIRGELSRGRATPAAATLSAEFMRLVSPHCREGVGCPELTYEPLHVR